MNAFRIDGVMVAGFRIRMVSFLFFVVAAFLMTMPSFAAEPAGKVVSVAGSATASGTDGIIRKLGQDAQVFAGDIISTGTDAKVRIVFADGGIIFLRPSSQLVVDEFRHTGDSAQDRSKFTLMRGGFRSVTGAIGQANSGSYRIDTPVATIGIRGTDHEGRYCAGDCSDLADIGAISPPDGLYTGTNSGRTIVGSVEFGPGQYGYTNPDGATFMLPEPPPILILDDYLRNALVDQPKPASEPGVKPELEPELEDEKVAGVVPAVPGSTADQGIPADQRVPGDSGAISDQSIPVYQPVPGDWAADEEGIEIPAMPTMIRSVKCR